MCTNLRRAHLMLLQRELLALRATQFLRLPLQRRISHGISSLMGPNPSNIKPHTSGDDRSHHGTVSQRIAQSLLLCSRGLHPPRPWGHADGNVNPTLAHTRERERESERPPARFAAGRGRHYLPPSSMPSHCACSLSPLLPSEIHARRRPQSVGTRPWKASSRRRKARFSSYSAGDSSPASIRRFNCKKVPRADE